MADEAQCQDFRQGCCGCCVNMSWSSERILRYLRDNTRAVGSVFRPGLRPGIRELVRVHLLRGGIWDHFLMTLLVMPTFGLSALVWRRTRASCCFAGFLDESAGRVGCLVHPERIPGPDLRRHAFPLVPTLGCNRGLRCPTLLAGVVDQSLDAIDASRRASPR